jgi:hypothetical protein
VPNIQPHDQDGIIQQQQNYFVLSCFYCVETICAPCGVIIAWAKFAKAESPMDFLNRIYPEPQSKPDYTVCIDKACLVLCHAIRSGMNGKTLYK